jgi:hypothetical protein
MKELKNEIMNARRPHRFGKPVRSEVKREGRKVRREKMKE